MSKETGKDRQTPYWETIDGRRTLVMDINQEIAHGGPWSEMFQRAWDRSSAGRFNSILERLGRDE